MLYLMSGFWVWSMTQLRNASVSSLVSQSTTMTFDLSGTMPKLSGVSPPIALGSLPGPSASLRAALRYCLRSFLSWVAR